MRKGNAQLWTGEDHDNNLIDLKIFAHQIPIMLLSAEETITQGLMSFSKQQISEHRNKINVSGEMKREDLKFQASLHHTVRPCLKTINWHSCGLD